MPSMVAGIESTAFMFPVGSAVLSDADGNQIVNVVTNNASVAIPVPSTVLLLLTALGLLWFVSSTKGATATHLTRKKSWLGLAALVVLAWAMPARAAVFNVAAGDSYGLIQAIALANTTPEPDTINLAAGTYTLTSAAETSVLNGANGLPKIVGEVVINGNGAIIERDVAAPAFRFFHIDGTGKLSLNQIVLKNARSSDAGNLDKLGAIFNQGEVNLSSCVVQDSSGGGLVNLNSGKATVTACSFFNNVGRGGAVLNESGTMSIVRSKIYANRAPVDGGGILNRAVLSIEASQITDNEAGANGGGLANGSNAVGTVVNSTFSGNRAAGGLGDGGGILNYNSLKLVNVTVAANSAGRFGGGVWNYAPSNGQNATLTLINTLLADNYGSVAVYGNGVAKDDCSNNGEIILGTNSLIENGGCSALAKGFLTGDPALGLLADNGGPTLTHRLLAGSKAIDAGNVADCPATDQRGTARPQDGDGNGIAACDIGAFEAGPLANSADLNQDGCIDNTDLSLLMAALVSTGPKPASYDLNGDGKVNVADARKLATLFSRPGGQSCQ
ncbi:MAG: choice-of-anchor Q domain-containing protein [Burkholderiales bacterium]